MMEDGGGRGEGPPSPLRGYPPRESFPRRGALPGDMPPTWGTFPPLPGGTYLGGAPLGEYLP